MPRVTADPDLEAALSARDEFEDPREWRRSRKGNLWRSWNYKTLTIFVRNDESFGWCIASENERSFSSHGFDSEKKAINALAIELGVGVGE